MPSSTSSSETSRREIPDRPWGRLLVWVLVVTFLALTGWELLARRMHHLPGSLGYTRDAMWARERAQLDKADHGVRMVISGSSRILFAADLDLIEARIGARPIQLAIEGTGPALYVKDIVENTDFDGLILIGVTPFLFNRLDQGFLGAGALEWQAGVGPSKRIDWQLHEFLAQRLGFIDTAFDLRALLDHYTYEWLPIREGAENLQASDEWKLGDTFADRQTNMWPPVEVEGSFDNRQMTAFWSPGLQRPKPTPERLTEMVEEAVVFFAPVQELLRERGGDLVFVRMPGSGPYEAYDTSANFDEQIWAPLIERLGAVGINSMDYPSLSTELEIPEWSHLSRASQDLWSQRLFDVLEPVYLQLRGRTLTELMSLTPRD
ncbi:MAG: hypothetical protein AAGA68_26615 [Pseudomonadota bacterium]